MKRNHQVVAIFAIFVTLSGWSYYHHGTTSYKSKVVDVKKGPFAEDKIVVLAQVTGENASWVDEELPEYGFYYSTFLALGHILIVY